MKSWCTVLAAGIAAACGSSLSDGAYEPAIRDSAGIVIVENIRPMWQDMDGWRVEATPVLQIGEIDGEGDYVFSNIVDAAQLSDGSIAVAEGGSNEIRFFDSRGRYVRSVGGSGAGPGEFRVIAGMVGMPGDSLLVLDPANRRLSVVHQNTGVSRSLPLPSQAMTLQLIGVLAHRSMIGWSIGPTIEAAGLGRDTLDLIRVSLDGSGSEVIGRFPGDSREFVRGLGPVSVITSVPTGFWFGSGEGYEIGFHDGSAGLVRLARLPYTPIPVSTDLVAQWKEHDAEVRKRFGTPESERIFPEYLPPYVAALADADDNVWVRPSGTGDRALWNVLDRNGRYLGDVVLPDGFIPFQIGPDFVLSRAWDEYRVEYLRLYRLTKPSSQ